MGEDKGRPRPLAPSRLYRLEFTTGADRQFRNLSKDLQDRLTPHLDALIRNPRPPGIKKLKWRAERTLQCFIPPTLALSQPGEGIL